MKSLNKNLAIIGLSAFLLFIFNCNTSQQGDVPASPITTTESITIQNPSFELPATPNDSFITSGPPTSWSAYGTIDNNNRAVGVLNPVTTTLYLDAVPHGSNVGVAFLMDNPGNQLQFNNSPAGMQQTLTATLQLNSTYTLTTYVGNLGTGSPPAPFAFTGFPNYRIELLAGGTVIAQDSNTLLPGEGRFLVSTVTATIGSTHAQANQNLGIRLINLNSAVGIEVNFDRLTLVRQY